jgi:hypothetical protein
VDIFRNQYYIVLAYINKINILKKNNNLKPVKADGQKTELLEQFLAICQKAIEVTDNMMALFPDPNDDNHKFAVDAKAGIQKNIDYYSKPQPVRKPGGSAASTSGKGK